MRGRWIVQLLVIGLSAGSLAAQQLAQYPTRYYILHTDLPPDGVREVAIRMTRIADEYIERTRGFSGVIRRQMPVYLYSDPEAYYATGAPRTSGGYFDGERLVALAQELGPRTWHRLQHEAFHQFSHQVIRGELPMWLSEGLAEYFGEAVFTGDGFTSGVIPQWRLKRVQETLAKKQFPPLSAMMQISMKEWNSELAIRNYDQAWTMVQFLAHAEEGRYQQGLARFISSLSDNRPWQRAWNETFGDVPTFEAKWKTYWEKLPANPTIDAYAQANVATLNGFLARAVSQRQQFADFPAFIAAAAEGSLQIHPEDWLPPALLKYAIDQHRELIKLGYTYTLTTPRGQRSPQLVCTTPDGAQIVGTFTIQSGRVVSPKTELIPKGGRR